MKPGTDQGFDEAFRGYGLDQLSDEEGDFWDIDFMG